MGAYPKAELTLAETMPCWDLKLPDTAPRALKLKNCRKKLADLKTTMIYTFKNNFLPFIVSEGKRKYWLNIGDSYGNYSYVNVNSTRPKAVCVRGCKDNKLPWWSPDNVLEVEDSSNEDSSYWR